MGQLQRAVANAASSARVVYKVPSRSTLGSNTTQSYPRLNRRLFTGKCLLPIKTPAGQTHRIQTLAIETSCDDTSVAILSITRNDPSSPFRTSVLFHETLTANTTPYGGIHPVIALESHQTRLAPLIARAIGHLDPTLDCNGMQERKPDFVSVTRGPGMRANLSVGLHTAKGLALAWNVPLVGVHHMLAHTLTGRLCSILPPPLHGPSVRQDGKQVVEREWRSEDVEPLFPFLSLLVSGGHTLLLDSRSLMQHKLLAETQDIALGDFLDKVARLLLTPEELRPPYGKALEDFAIPPGGESGYAYTAPRTRGEELRRRSTSCGWSVDPPLAESKSGLKSSRRMVYSFSGLLSSIQRFAALKTGSAASREEALQLADILSLAERRELAREVQIIAFEHLASRILLHLQDLEKFNNGNVASASPPTITPSSEPPSIKKIVVSGGVASNSFLRYVLRSMLDIRGHSDLELKFPPRELCTDNALMVAWAGLEMFDAGHRDGLGIEPLRKWGMEDLGGGIAFEGCEG